MSLGCESNPGKILYRGRGSCSQMVTCCSDRGEEILLLRRGGDEVRRRRMVTLVLWGGRTKMVLQSVQLVLDPDLIWTWTSSQAGKDLDLMSSRDLDLDQLDPGAPRLRLGGRGQEILDPWKGSGTGGSPTGMVKGTVDEEGGTDEESDGEVRTWVVAVVWW